MTKKDFIIFWLIPMCYLATLMFNSRSQPNKDEGVIINGVKWANSNVDEPGTFAANPEDAGMFYRGNSKEGWPTGSYDMNMKWGSHYAGLKWNRENDPSPPGWRLPIYKELMKLYDYDKVNHGWTNINGVNGMKFTDKKTGNSIFLPAAGSLSWYGGTRVNDGIGLYRYRPRDTERESYAGDMRWDFGFRSNGVCRFDTMVTANMGVGDNSAQSVRPVAKNSVLREFFLELQYDPDFGGELLFLFLLYIIIYNLILRFAEFVGWRKPIKEDYIESLLR